MKLRTYTGDFVKPTGFCSVTVQNRGQSEEPPIYVMKNEGPTLFGREWLDSIQLDWPLTLVRNIRHHSYTGRCVEEYSSTDTATKKMLSLWLQHQQSG